MRVEKLICIDETNHNKVYEMHQLSSDSWVAKYGRVGAALVETTYPMSQFDKKYREKLRKGYKPITELVTVAAGPEASASDLFAKVDAACREVLEFLQSCARDTVKRNYTIAASAVTEKQIAKAQEIIDALTVTITTTDHIAGNDPGWSAAILKSANGPGASHC